MKIRCADPEMTPKYRLLNVSNEFKGTYIHPKLVHFVAEWVDLEYAFTVSEIMDSINDKVHEELNNKQLPDNVENAKPIFNEIAKSIAPNIQQLLTIHQRGVIVIVLMNQMNLKTLRKDY